MLSGTGGITRFDFEFRISNFEFAIAHRIGDFGFRTCHGVVRSTKPDFEFDGAEESDSDLEACLPAIGGNGFRVSDLTVRNI